MPPKKTKKPKTATGRKKADDPKLHFNMYILTSKIEAITGKTGITKQNLTPSGAQAAMQDFFNTQLDIEIAKKKK